MTGAQSSERVTLAPATIDYIRAIAKARAAIVEREMPGNPFPRHSPWWEKLNAAYRAARARSDRENRHAD